MTDHPTPEQVEAAKEDFVRLGIFKSNGMISRAASVIYHSHSRLEQIVAKLPVDAEGNPVVPGQNVWFVNSGGPFMATVHMFANDETDSAWDMDVSESFPTRAAAEAALEGE